VPQDQDKEARRCPGENYDINVPICKGRQRMRYPKCLLCRHRSEETNARLEVDDTVEPSVFRRDCVLGTYGKDLTEQTARKIGAAFVEYIRARKGTAARMAVGRDIRSSSHRLGFSVSRGITDAGMDVCDIGEVGTEVVGFIIADKQLDGGVMVTGSHHQKELNGFLFFGEGGELLGWDDGIEQISALTCQRRKTKPPRTGRIQNMDVLDEFKSFVATFVGTLKPMRIVVDAANGMAGKLAPLVFEDMAGIEIVPMNFDADGDFPNHQPNPLVPANLEALRKTVVDESAHFGVAFDGDCDRIVFVDDRGRIVDGDVTGALISRELLAKQPDGIVVYDLRCSASVREEIKNAGGKPLRSKVGADSLRGTMKKRDGLFACGLSGDYYYRDFFGGRSGMVTLIQVLNLLSRSATPLSELADSIRRYTHSGELRIPLPRPDEAEDKLRALETQFPDGKVDKLDGLTVAFSNWWFNIRREGGENRLRLNVEGRNHDVMEDGKQRVLEALRSIGI